MKKAAAVCGGGCSLPSRRLHAPCTRLALFPPALPSPPLTTPHLPAPPTTPLQHPATPRNTLQRRYGVCEWMRVAEKLGMPPPATIQNAYSLLCRNYEEGLAEVS